MDLTALKVRNTKYLSLEQKGRLKDHVSGLTAEWH